LITLTINGKRIEVAANTTVAAAMLSSGEPAFRTSVTREPRSALCGMGICFECRVTIDDIPHRRSCTTLAVEGMEVATVE
jgi:D-hydroxyproline dehydrogenase subunit gamma